MTAILLLLVEDEAAVQAVIEAELNDAGFTVVNATDGAEALAKLDAGAAKFRAIVTDIRLGSGPDGWEIGRHARELVADIPVVYITGDSMHERSSNGVPGSIMIAKPFATPQLTTALSMLLNNADMHGAATGAAPD